jgi:phosphoserine aminotransferase
VEGRKSNSERRILKKVDEIVEDYRDEFGDILDYNTAVEEVSHQLEVSESKAKGLIKQLRRM